MRHNLLEFASDPGCARPYLELGWHAVKSLRRLGQRLCPTVGNDVVPTEGMGTSRDDAAHTEWTTAEWLLEIVPRSGLMRIMYDKLLDTYPDLE